MTYGSIPFVVDDPNSLGTAYGIFTCILNMGTSSMSLFIGWVHDQTKHDSSYGYFWVEMCFIIINTIVVILILLLYYCDFKMRCGILSASNPYAKFE